MLIFPLWHIVDLQLGDEITIKFEKGKKNFEAVFIDFFSFPV